MNEASPIMPGFISCSNLTSFSENPSGQLPAIEGDVQAPSGVVIDWIRARISRCSHTSLVSPPALHLDEHRRFGSSHVVGLRRRGQKVDLLAGVRQILDHRQTELALASIRVPSAASPCDASLPPAITR